MINFWYILFIIISFGFYFACALLPALISRFVDQSKRARWFRFAIAWTLLSLLFILLTPDDSGGFFTQLPLDKRLTALVMGILFALVSIPVLLIGKSKPQ